MVADLFSVLGLPNLINDGRFRTNGDRIANRAALHDLIVPEIRKRQATELAQFCVEKEIPTALIQDISEVVAQEQAQAREMVVETGVANVRSAGIPIKLSLTPGVLRTPPPPLGSANDGLLGSGRPGHS
jgi:crotonobetainyl-CoA:carnitine CoA-transferase CaiB-like acyl-CoA transferase